MGADGGMTASQKEHAAHWFLGHVHFVSQSTVVASHQGLHSLEGEARRGSLAPGGSLGGGGGRSTLCGTPPFPSSPKQPGERTTGDRENAEMRARVAEAFAVASSNRTSSHGRCTSRSVLRTCSNHEL